MEVVVSTSSLRSPLLAWKGLVLGINSLQTWLSSSAVKVLSATLNVWPGFEGCCYFGVFVGRGSRESFCFFIFSGMGSQQNNTTIKNDIPYNDVLFLF